MGYIDDNTRNTWLLYNETTGGVEPARVDPITGALLVYIMGTASVTPASYNRAGIDGNSRNTISLWNDTSSAIESARCGTDGSLLVISV